MGFALFLRDWGYQLLAGFLCFPGSRIQVAPSIRPTDPFLFPILLFSPGPVSLRRFETLVDSPPLPVLAGGRCRFRRWFVPITDARLSAIGRRPLPRPLFFT